MRIKKIGDWIQYTGGMGRTFYFNEKTYEFQWEKPESIGGGEGEGDGGKGEGGGGGLVDDNDNANNGGGKGGKTSSPNRSPSRSPSRSPPPKTKQEKAKKAMARAQREKMRILQEWMTYRDPNTGMTYYHNSTTGLVGIHVMHTSTTLPATLRRRSSHQFESRPPYPRYFPSRSLCSPLHLPSVTQWTDPASEPPQVSKKASPAMLLHKLLVTTNLEAYSEQFQNKGITSLDALHAMTVSSEPRQVDFSADTLTCPCSPTNSIHTSRRVPTYLSTILRTTTPRTIGRHSSHWGKSAA